MVILIDNGHGKNCAGKQSPLLKGCDVDVPDWYIEDGRFKEWKYTRDIAKDVVATLEGYGYDARLLVKEDEDISLGERCRRTNFVCSKNGDQNVLLVSIHANACGDSTKWMSAQGWEAYTSIGRTRADDLAEFLYKRAEENFSGRKIRKDLTDGDSDKESNFYILKNTRCPAVLTENFFYDNKDDLEYMVSNEGVHRIVRTHVEGIIDYIDFMKKLKK